MLDVLQGLRDIIREELIIINKSSIVLEETQETTNSSPVTLSKCDESVVLLQVDGKRIDDKALNIHPTLKTTKGLCKLTDYLLFVNKRNTLYCLSIELKSKHESDWLSQANAGIVFAKYLVGMLENYTKSKAPVIEYRALLFCNGDSLSPRLARKPTNGTKFEYLYQENYDCLAAKRPNGETYELGMFLR